MTFETIRAVLAWCTTINLIILLVWFVFYAFARDWAYRLHSKWFKLSEDQFAAIHYCGIALFKIGVILFNLVPYLAMHIVG